MRKDIILWLIAGIWLVLLSGTLYAMAEYGSSAGESGSAPQTWPVTAVAGLETHQNKPTLVLFAHPLCPCTRATLWELENMTNRLHGLFKLHVLFFQPDDTSAMPTVWEASDLRELAGRLPDTLVHDDVEGAIASHFGAYTSGQVLLYDSVGQLQFAGGITPSRGHVGANPGSAAVISAILSDDNVDPLQPAQNPVYGCSLHAADADDRKFSPVLDDDIRTRLLPADV